MTEAMVQAQPLEPLDYQAILRAGSKSFSFASKFLPPKDRLDAAVVYTFCRHVDDAADEAESPEAGREALSVMREELRGQRPVLSSVGAFLTVANRRNIDIAHAEELLTGVASDLGTVRLEDDQALLRYSYRVAGTVGLLMCPILGVTDREALPFAVDLGVGMQLTNICRDVAEDAGMGRVYLPSQRLKSYGVSADALLHKEASSDEDLRRNVSKVVGDIIELADSYYESGELGMRMIPPRPRVAIAVASRVYRAIGHKLRARGGDPWHGRTVLGRWEKVGCAFRVLGGMLLGQHRSMRISAPVHQARLHAPLADLPGTNPSAKTV